MLAIVMTALFVAAAPAQEVVEDLEQQTTAIVPENETADSQDLESLEEIVLEDGVLEEEESAIAEDDSIVFDEK